MEIIGYLASILIGVSLGLIGGGGSILTVPVLVYLFGIHPVMATAYSLFIVGSTSFVGAIPKFKKGFVHLKTALIFGTPALVTVYATRKFLIPLIPDRIFTVGAQVITKPVLLMVIFALLMLVASFSMIRGRQVENSLPDHNQNPTYNYKLIVLEGVIVGILTGLVGAGGGFLIIPALVLFSKLSMKTAIGTSLVIIAAKSLIGFTGDLSHYMMDWSFLLIVTGLAIIGIFIGNWLNNKVPGKKLEKAFGWFVLVMGIGILIKELFLDSFQ
ncbi:MAG: sulfite exporter TauE/SafE family protein [Chitinophagaceae bacterium]|jgi:uncharacterized membrane protein YfcA|nr:sulfite exporter TauE/SafE family protein [Chitinophagaceae bacterium]